MKKLKLALFAVVLILTPTLYSCLDDDDDKYSLLIATVKVNDGKDYYFLMDDGNKVLPGDTTAIHNYKVVDGQRVFVYFDELEEKVNGYDYNIRVISIQNILTKGVIPITEATQDSIGDDPANLAYVWFGGGFLNIEFHIMGSNSSSKPHMINLVRDEENPGEEEDGYINLEFRHNAQNDYPLERLVSMVSFKPPFTDDYTKKGIKIRVNTIYNGVQYYKVDFPQGTGELKRANESIATSIVPLN
ncbi:MAG: NigD-like protein [Bacteroides sp.]|nr:NigD-like protein [Bacteroides sp.]